MKTIKHVLREGLLFFIAVSFFQCSSAQKLEEKVSVTFGEVYCHKWIAGVEGGGSGLNIFIPINESTIALDSVYFRGKAAKLEVSQGKTLLFIGRFHSEINRKRDIIMSNEPYAEYNNPIPIKIKKIPFELKDNECVISYKEGRTTKYFKVDNVVEKDLIPYPSAPPNKQ